MELDPRSEALKDLLASQAGASATPVPVPGNRPTPALMYKVMGKLFAILSVRGEPFVILKCDPHLAEILREQYASVGHRSHLDRRFWIAVDLGGDVPDDAVARLAAQSYALVRDGLTRKQKAALEAATAS
ncbi:MAG: MmcQ/YjbR family DNA-binding protein [Proteobacteria bacterium]|nr:MmcQ/YjbR family DNA-binding protein [Pseudomonadota bacterium]